MFIHNNNAYALPTTGSEDSDQLQSMISTTITYVENSQQMTQVNQNLQNEGQDNLSMTIDPNNENYSMTIDQNAMTDDDQMTIDLTSMNQD